MLKLIRNYRYCVYAYGIKTLYMGSFPFLSFGSKTDVSVKESTSSKKLSRIIFFCFLFKICPKWDRKLSLNKLQTLISTAFYLWFFFSNSCILLYMEQVSLISEKGRISCISFSSSEATSSSTICYTQMNVPQFCKVFIHLLFHMGQWEI